MIEEEDIPWEFNDLEKDKVIREQRSMPEYALGIGEEEEYIITDGLLFTLCPHQGNWSTHVWYYLLQQGLGSLGGHMQRWVIKE